MEAPGYWKAQTEASGEVVLCVDFEATGRAESSFADLVPQLSPPRETWVTTMPPASAGLATAADYAARWAEGFAAAAREACAVLGFCAGGVFAVAVAQEIGRRGGREPAVMLLDPQIPTAATLVAQFSQAMQGVAGFLSPQESALVSRAVEQARALDDPAAAGTALTGLYRDIGGSVFTRLGLNAGYREELFASFSSLMAYLVAAGRGRPAQGWKSAIAVLSRDAPDPADDAAEVIRLDVSHADLLRSADTARVVCAVLRGEAP